MPSVTLQVVVIIVLTILNGLFAMSETAMVSARRARLWQRADSGDGGARAALKLAEAPNRFLSTVQIGISLIGVLAGALGGAAVAQPLADVLRSVFGLGNYAEAIAFGVVVVAITYLSLIVGELVPKRLALNNPEAVASRVAAPMRLLSALAAPVVWLLSASTEAVLRLLGARRVAEPPVTEQEVEILLEVGAQAGVFEEAERDLVGRALRLDDRRVRELLTPRPMIVWLDVDDTPEEHRRQVASTRHSHYPVARGALDNLLGLASMKDACGRALAGQPVDLLGSLRPTPFVSENAPATDALEAFKRSGLSVALVVDERGTIEGLITLTDILEAIVGDVPDADESVEQPIVQREDGSWLVDGLLPADELKEHLRLRALPREDEEDYQTVGGLMLAELGRIPLGGDHFEWEGFRFEVVDMDGHRIDKVLVVPPQTVSDDPTEET